MEIVLTSRAVETLIELYLCTIEHQKKSIQAHKTHTRKICKKPELAEKLRKRIPEILKTKVVRRKYKLRNSAIARQAYVARMSR